MAFKNLPAKPDFVEMEHQWLERWGKSGLVKKYLHKNDQSKKRFSFLDGPITANNPMGVHHAWGRTLKDLYQRYHNMKGEAGRFQNGFDCQGLWVEVEVEKELGFKDKKEIEKYGIAKFVQKCQERVQKYATIQTEQSKRLGYFMDWDNSYYTMSDENNYMIWHFLKKCWQEGNLYKGRDTVPWCPRCGTAISQHEILTEDYQAVTHQAVYFKLPISSRKNESFLVWTTSPWTIPANVALAVHPEFKYGRFQSKQTGEVLILLKDLAGKVFGKSQDWELVETVSGKKLAGWSYQAPYDHLPQVQKAKKEKPKKFHLVVLDKDLVTAEEGTGLVHISPGSGPEDYQLAQREDLSVIEAIDEAGNYLDGFGPLTAKNAKNQPELIFNFLKEQANSRFFFKIENYRHRYPVCWRCKTELMWRSVDEWYLAMGKPSKAKGKRQKAKVKSLRERMIRVARQARWIPDWGLDRELDWLRNMDDWLISKKRYWGLALPIWECQQCGSFEVIGSREELRQRAVQGWDKFDGQTPHRPWVDEIKIRCPKCQNLTSRIADVGNPWLDAGIVSFSTLKYQTDKSCWQKWYPADLILECFPGQFKNWFYSLIAMATVLEDTTPFKVCFGHASVRDEKGEEMHKSKGNAIWFDEAAEKMGVDVMRWLYVKQRPALNLNFGYQIADKTRRQFHLTLWNVYRFLIIQSNNRTIEQSNNRTILDRWIVSRFQQTLKLATEKLDDFQHDRAAEAMGAFVQDLSTWYLRRSREREDKKAFQTTLGQVLVTFSKMLAIFTPFLAEEIYQNLSGGKSVHLQDWPIVNDKLIDKKLEAKMAWVRQVCELGHSARKASGIKVRQPLNELRIMNHELRIDEELLVLIKDELNVKKVVFGPGKGELKVKLDTQITPALKVEGEARELIRRIQDLRKKQNVRPDQQITVTAPRWPKQFADDIKAKTLTKKLVKGNELLVEAIEDKVTSREN